ncbi:hypothetical protein AKJ09_10142 [Labilithrix luteola]|uniref:Uncharacterized protein n=1 Tax=Labilithrix luteola TaxID=1391654 RepID=A0A0K1QCK6_9BACT|nr:hypothetical protein AKJ09_10142 [Labilithrix luteola]
MACSSSSKRGTFTEQDPTETGDAGAGSFITGDGGMGGTCGANPAEDKDYDGDGYTGKNDCNECDPNVNAGAFDVPGNGIDEDCNGTPDDELTACDDGLDIAGTAMEGAKAIGLCKEATDDQMWGVIKAEWVLPDGKTQKQPLSQGILSQFGVNAAQAGGSMLAISSGSARAPGDPGYHEPGDKTGFGGWDKGYTCGTPDGYPKESASCSGSGGGSFDKAHDGAALRVKIRVPSNAKSFKFQQNFFTFEFPDFICSTFNDFFVTMMDPAPSGLPDGNIAFDQDTNPISVNNSLLQVCSAQEAGGKDFSCPLGDSSLSGTGFEGHAATGWLTTTTPVDDVRGKEITLTWAVWDQGDGRLDSTALIDDFTWSVDAADGSKTVATPK